MSGIDSVIDRAPIACPDVPTLLGNCTADQEPAACVAYPKRDNRTGRASLDGGASNCFNVHAVYGGYCPSCGVERVVSLPIGSLSTVYVCACVRATKQTVSRERSRN